MPSQPLLIPFSRSPWSWLVRTFPQERRELATAVLRVQWDKIKAEGKGTRRGTLAAAHRYVKQAELNPDSVRWAENAKGRKHAERGDRWKADLEKLAAKLWE